MDNKILIISNDNTNLLDSLVYMMEQEKVDYVISHHLKDLSDNITMVIYINYKNDEMIKQLSDVKVPIIVISDEKNIIKNENTSVNYVITNLISDNTSYTDVQKEYLFKKGIYWIVMQKVNEFITNVNNMNGLIIDTTECKTIPENWMFKFDSIAETYNWLSKKNRSGNKNFIKKEINFYNKKVYNDSSKEINYLVDKIMNIKDGMNLIDIFICTKEEFQKLKDNYFFKSLLNNLSFTYNIYFIDRDSFSKEEPELLNKLLDGVIIYEDCVYVDTYDDEYSLGTVNCNKDIIIEYNKQFDYILNKYGLKINSDGDINGI